MSGEGERGSGPGLTDGPGKDLRDAVLTVIGTHGKDLHGSMEAWEKLEDALVDLLVQARADAAAEERERAELRYAEARNDAAGDLMHWADAEESNKSGSPYLATDLHLAAMWLRNGRSS